MLAGPNAPAISPTPLPKYVINVINNIHVHFPSRGCVYNNNNNELNLIIRFEILWQIDLVKKKAKNWNEEGAVPSEPFFVPRPGATEEDDGKSGHPLII